MDSRRIFGSYYNNNNNNNNNGATNKGKLICNSLNDIISENFDSEKVDEDEDFSYKDILHFFLELPKYYTNQKSFLRFVAL